MSYDFKGGGRFLKILSSLTMVFNNRISYSVFEALHNDASAHTSEIIALVKRKYAESESPHSRTVLARQLAKLVHQLLLTGLGLPLLSLKAKDVVPDYRGNVDSIHELAGNIIRSALADVDWNQVATAIATVGWIAECAIEGQEFCERETVPLLD